MGWTSLVAGLIFTAVLSLVYVTISVPISGSVAAASSANSNMFYFLLSTPSILLYTTAGVLEALLWGTSPEKMSYGFASFEIAKVITGYTAIVIFHLTLVGAILAVIGAQVVQIASLFVFTRKEYTSGPSMQIIKSMVKNGWIALLNNIHPLIVSLDFLLVGVLTGSTNILALYGAALIFGNVVNYSGAIASGLYPSILSGKDPSESTNQIFELQLIFLFPMVLGAIVLREQLLNLLNSEYTSGAFILVIITIGAIFSSLQSIPDSVIAGSDTTDVNEKANFASYLKSKLFLLSKINLGLAVAYLISVAIAAYFLRVPSPATANIAQYDTLGELWATASAGMFAAGYFLKMHYVRKMIRIRINSRLLSALVISSIFYSLALYLLSMILTPTGGEISQALRIFAIGIISLAVYGGLMYSLSEITRNLMRAVVRTFV